ncbi:MAG TPA: hypothetical protein VIJ14_09115 [Rhabdochlamydiaceae bacterium]
MSDIEKEFKETSEKINAKIKEVVVALREANRLAQEAGLPSLIYTQFIQEEDDTLEKLTEAELKILDDNEEWDGESSPLKMKLDMIDVSDLEGEIESAGWSTSSSYC